MSSRSLDEWLDWQSALNPKTIELGLGRVSQVWQRLGSPKVATKVVTIAGTNGKGSSQAFLEAILLSAAYSVACYSSPHILRYNERIRVNGKDASDEAICNGFERIEAARDELPLTYFEYGTLAALLLSADNQSDIAILEVGLGGRLDAVNIIDADVALVTGIALDHMDWLGDTIELIGAEKAGIARANRPLIFASNNMPQSVADVALEKQASLLRLGQTYSYEISESSWNWKSADSKRHALPFPSMRGAIQLQNAASVLQVIDCLNETFPVDQQAVREGLINAKATARFEVYPRECRWILDVAHNPQAMGLLKKQLVDFYVAGKTHAVVGMLKDKAIAESLAILAPQIDCWHFIDLSAEQRGASAVELAEALLEGSGVCEYTAYTDVSECFLALDNSLDESDLVLVTGSFSTIAAAVQTLDLYTQ